MGRALEAESGQLVLYLKVSYFHPLRQSTNMGAYLLAPYRARGHAGPVRLAPNGTGRAPARSPAI